MKINHGMIIGFVFGLCLSLFISAMFTSFAIAFAGGGLPLIFGGSFLYTSTLILFILAAILSAYYFSKQKDKQSEILSKLSALLFFVSAILLLFVQGRTNGIEFLYGEGWLYYATIIPFVLTFSVLGYYFTKRRNASNKTLWFLSLLSALFISLYSGTIGALFGEFIVRGGSLRTYIEGGYVGVNVKGVLVAGTVYAFILIPVTVPLARLIIQLFLAILKKGKIAA